MVVQHWAGGQTWSSDELLGMSAVESEEGRDPVKCAGQSVILLTPVKSNLKNPVSDCQVFSSAPFC